LQPGAARSSDFFRRSSAANLSLDFTSGGAAYEGRQERAPAFEFCLTGSRRRNDSSHVAPSPLEEDSMETTSSPAPAEFTWLRGLLAEHFYLSAEEIQLETQLTDLGADSLDLVSIATSIEGEYGIAIREDAFPDLRTVADLAHQIERLRAAA
jgi:acyl carrier protein